MMRKYSISLRFDIFDGAVFRLRMIKARYGLLEKLKFMRNINFTLIAVMTVLLLAGGSCKLHGKKKSSSNAKDNLRVAVNHRSNLPFDSNLVFAFYRSYPGLNRYHTNVLMVYRQNRYNHIWYDGRGVVEAGQALYGKVKELNVEGVSSTFPYQDKIDGIFKNEVENTLSQTETDLMLTNLYLFYAEKVYKGLDDTTTTDLGWLLPRKQVSYTALLDSVISDPALVDRNDSVLLGQYYKLRDFLVRYREIEKKGGWKPGKNNSLGLVKFIFPNSDDIYIHDTPAKSLFAMESRAFSHGCIRVAKPRDLAIAVLKDDPNWTPEKIDGAMHAGKETTCLLKNKVPVYIGYFTAWVDENGAINFYKDIYQEDERLAGLLFNEK